MLQQDLLERLEVVSINEQQLVLVELNLHRAVGVQGGQAGTAVVQQQGFVVEQRALEDDRVDVLAVHIRVRSGLGFVTRLHHDINVITQRVEQVHEDVEQPFGGDGRGQHRHLVAGLGVAIDIAPVSFPGYHFEPDRRANSIRQQEISVPSDAEVGIKLFLAQIVESRSRHASWVVSENTLKEALNETHGKAPS